STERRSAAGSSDETTGTFSRVDTVTTGDTAGDHRGQVAVRSLKDPARSRRQVVADLGGTDREVVEVDHVDVGATPRLEHTSVAEAVQRRVVRRELGDDRLDGQRLTARTVPGPVR